MQCTLINRLPSPCSERNISCRELYILFCFCNEDGTMSFQTCTQCVWERETGATFSGFGWDSKKRSAVLQEHKLGWIYYILKWPFKPLQTPGVIDRSACDLWWGIRAERDYGCCAHDTAEWGMMGKITRTPDLYWLSLIILLYLSLCPSVLMFLHFWLDQQLLITLKLTLQWATTDPPIMSTDLRWRTNHSAAPVDEQETGTLRKKSARALYCISVIGKFILLY